MHSISYYLHNPNSLAIRLLERYFTWLPDKMFLKIRFRLSMGYWLNLKNPQTFSEKIQWLKLYNRKPEFTMMVDKVKVKSYIASIIGEKYIIPTLGVWDNPDEINFDVLPNRFVLKCNHNSGTGMYICKDKSKMDIEKVKAELRKGLKQNYYKKNREWSYKNVEPRIIAEKYMEDKNGELKDYKFFCFDGCVKCLEVDYDRFIEHHRNIYDINWNLMPFSIAYPSKEGIVIEKPQNFEKMVEIAQILSKGCPHVRVDLYNIEGTIYFGELTFYHGSGYETFKPSEWNLKFGEWIQLPNKKIY